MNPTSIPSARLSPGRLIGNAVPRHDTGSAPIEFGESLIAGPVAVLGRLLFTAYGNFRSIPTATAIPAASAEHDEDKDYDEQRIGVHVRLLEVRAKRMITQGELLDFLTKGCAVSTRGDVQFRSYSW